MITELEVTVISTGAGTVRSRACGEADQNTSWRLRDTLEPLLRPGIVLLVEADRLEFVDSWAINEFVHLAHAAHALSGVIYVVNPTAPVARVLEVAGVADLLRIHQEYEGEHEMASK